MSRRLAIAIILVVAGVLGAGCGSDEGDQGSSQASAGDQPTGQQFSTSPVVTTRRVGGCLLRSDASCPGADLSNGNLTDLQIRRVNLSGAKLIGADLHGSHIWTVNLEGADLTNAKLNPADLRGHSNLSGANLTGVRAYHATLSGANLSGANLKGAKLAGSEVRKTSLAGANLLIADLTGVDLFNVDLRGAILPDGSPWAGSTGGLPTSAPGW